MSATSVPAEAGPRPDSGAEEIGAPSAAERRAALQEVVRSQTFLRAPRLRDFLTFVCEREIAGRGTEITEQAVGVEALGRPPDYSPAEDAVVRRRAADLREKLKEAYATELCGARIRIELPRGGYVPRFVRAPGEEAATGAAEPTPPPGAQPVARPAIRVPSSLFWFMTGALAGGSVASLAFLTFLWSRSAPRPPVEPGTTYEAEGSGNLYGATWRDACATCSGAERVRRIGGAPENAVVLSDVTVPRSGGYTLVIFYLLSGHRSLLVSVNDDPPIELPLQGDSWLTPARASLTVSLRAGRNTLKFHNDKNYAPDLDRIVIR
jgi:hypothetical protein